MINQQTDLIKDIYSIKDNRQAMRELEFEASVEYGEFYWHNTDFQESDIAMLMEKYNAEINYYTHQFNLSINLN